MQHEYNKLASAPVTQKIEVSKPIEPIRKRPPPRRNNDWDDLHSDDAFISLKDLGL